MVSSKYQVKKDKVLPFLLTTKGMSIVIFTSVVVLTVIIMFSAWMLQGRDTSGDVKLSSPFVLYIEKKTNYEVDRLQWAYIQDANAYLIYQDGELVDTIAFNQYRLNHLEDGTYTFYVVASNGTVNSQNSNEVVVIIETVDSIS